MLGNKGLRSKPIKLLLIEDDNFMREMIALVLETENYKVTGVENGGEALRLLDECSEYGAVISDMYLPDTDGLILFEKINVAYPNLLFLILTSETDETIVQRAKNLGITYILKDENFAESVLVALKNNLY
ncbi:MAG: hybrid sensor histidine kinase/response regulator [Firmicutes bacterium]|nr:hybrid sensor histidine kinase/response regulator [Bacillota bacterium]